jgi:hypothetical protein
MRRSDAWKTAPGKCSSCPTTRLATVHARGAARCASVAGKWRCARSSSST